MKTRILKDVHNGVYSAQIGVYELSQAETELIKKHGPPLVAVGGQITGSPAAGPKSGTTVDFTLKEEDRRLPDDFPVKKLFDVRDDEDADAQMEVYSAVLHQRVIDAYQALLAKEAAYTGEFIQTLPKE